MIIEDVDFQPRFKAFMGYKGLNVGDSYKGYEFLIFIQSNAIKFRKEKKIHEYFPFNKQQQEEFTNYLFNLKEETN